MEKAYFLMDDNGGKTPLCSETPTFGEVEFAQLLGLRSQLCTSESQGVEFSRAIIGFSRGVQLWKPVKFESCNLDQFGIYKSHNPSKTCENPEKIHANNSMPTKAAR